MRSMIKTRLSRPRPFMSAEALCICAKFRVGHDFQAGIVEGPVALEQICVILYEHRAVRSCRLEDMTTDRMMLDHSSGCSWHVTQETKCNQRKSYRLKFFIGQLRHHSCNGFSSFVEDSFQAMANFPVT